MRACATQDVHDVRAMAQCPGGSSPISPLRGIFGKSIELSGPWVMYVVYARDQVALHASCDDLTTSIDPDMIQGMFSGFACDFRHDGVRSIVRKSCAVKYELAEL